MPFAQLILLAVIAGGLAFGWILARWLESRFDRDRNAGSDQLLDAMEMARSSRHSIELHTRTENLPRILDCIREQVDSGFGTRDVRQLAHRITRSRRRAGQISLLPVRIHGIRSDLDIQWSRDASSRVRLLILAAPKIIRSLKRRTRHLVAAKGPAPAAPLMSGNLPEPDA